MTASPTDDETLNANISAPADQPAPKGRIGPNAIIRVAEALSAREGEATCRAVFALAGIEHRLTTPPTEMVDEREVSELQRALFERLGVDLASEIAHEAGRLTGEYLLAHRIPKFAQIVLRLLPRALAARILTKAIAQHSWTFAGSGHFSYEFDDALWLRLKGSPICRLLFTEQPACHYYVGTFERVFREMLGPKVNVVEVSCEATGAPECVFRLTWI